MTFAERLVDLNRWYEGLPENRRILVYPAVLVAAALINTSWTGSPIGLVFLLTALALIAIRRSYTSGLLASGAPVGGPIPEARFRTEAGPVPPPVATKLEAARSAGSQLPKAQEAPSPGFVTEPEAAAAVGARFQKLEREHAVPAEPPPPATVEAVHSVPLPSPTPARNGQANRSKRPGTGSRRKGEGRSGRRKQQGEEPLGVEPNL